MDTFRKWLNKPKADDKSLLARFYHADRSLTAVTSELDSFDGRAEPDRCSRLVSRLRQGQDKVLAITNLIMEELLGEDRNARAFRAKFPEEVLQENLAGQLWFGAECLAAGSSIMNREQESKEMRPLAQAVTKSLGNVRNLLRDQCLRYNVPNSKTLHLNINDSNTEQLYESLKIFDRLFAEFELRYVSAMVPVKTKHEYEMQELISVLFSETLQRALKIGLLEQDKVDAFDPALMFSIPRLAIISGLVIYPNGPLNMNMTSDELSEMFRPFRTILIKIRDLLNKLNKNDLFQLEKLLCTNEDINTRAPVGTSSIEAPSTEQQNTTNNNNNSTNCDDNNTGSSNNNNNNDNNNENNRLNPTTTTANVTTTTTTNSTEAQISVTSSLSKVLKHTRHHHQQKQHSKTPRSPSISSVSANSSIQSTPTASPIPSPTPSNSLASTASSDAASTSTNSAAYFSNDDEDDDVDNDNLESDDDEEDESEAVNSGVGDDILLSNENVDIDIVAADCASGYLIPNTNFGNLLQPQEVPLTGNFIASEDDELNAEQNEELQADSADDDDDDDEVLPSTSNSRLMRRTQQQQQNEHKTTINENINNNNNNNDNNNSNSDNPSTSQNIEKTLDNNSSSSSRNCRHHHHHHHHRPNHRSSSHSHHHHHHNKLKRLHHSGNSNSSTAIVTDNIECNNECSDNKCDKKSSTKSTSATTTSPSHQDTSSIDSRTSSSLSDVGDSPRENPTLVALRANGRLKFKNTESLLHRLFVCIAGVADQLQTNFASDLRHILRSVFLMNMSITQDDELDIPEKTKESELFEFRASENDVIQESSNGSNQSIYSAEEVNPELDNVFSCSNNNNNNNNTNGSRSSISSIESPNNNGSSSSNNQILRHSTGSTIQRVNTIDLGTNNELNTNSLRQHVERSRSLGDHEQQDITNNSLNINNNNNNNHGYNNSNSGSGSSSSSGGGGSRNRRLSAYITGRRLSTSPQNSSTTTTTTALRHRNNSVGSNSPGSSTSSSSSESNSPVSERAHQNFSSNNTANRAAVAAASPSTTTTTATTSYLAPPAWIPDDKAPRCMSCHTQFTAFRRRHHCRNCGGVFCSVCSNASAPLPKYGLTKAVRVCRDCYVREVRNSQTTQLAATAQHHHQTAAGTATAGGS